MTPEQIVAAVHRAYHKGDALREMDADRITRVRIRKAHRAKIKELQSQLAVVKK